MAQHARGDALAYVKQTQQQVLGADVVVAEGPSFTLRIEQDLVCAPDESVGVSLNLPRRGLRVCWQPGALCERPVSDRST